MAMRHSNDDRERMRTLVDELAEVITVPNLAHTLHTSRVNVRAWRRGDRHPHPDIAPRIPLLHELTMRIVRELDDAHAPIRWLYASVVPGSPSQLSPAQWLRDPVLPSDTEQRLEIAASTFIAGELDRRTTSTASAPRRPRRGHTPGPHELEQARTAVSRAEDAFAAAQRRHDAARADLDRAARALLQAKQAEQEARGSIRLIAARPAGEHEAGTDPSAELDLAAAYQLLSQLRPAVGSGELGTHVGDRIWLRPADAAITLASSSEEGVKPDLAAAGRGLRQLGSRVSGTDTTAVRRIDGRPTRVWDLPANLFRPAETRRSTKGP